MSGLQNRRKRYHRKAKYGSKELCYDSREHIVVDHACDWPKQQSAADKRVVFPALRAAAGDGRETGFLRIDRQGIIGRFMVAFGEFTEPPCARKRLEISTTRSRDTRRMGVIDAAARFVSECRKSSQSRFLPHWGTGSLNARLITSP